MSKYLHYLNGRFVREEKLLISPRDLGFSRGFGVFDYLKTYGSKPFKLEKHLTRLMRSAKLIGLKHNYNPKRLTKIIGELLAKNDDGNDKGIKIILSGGISNSLSQTAKATLIIIVDPLNVEKGIYRRGVKVNLVKFMRYIPEAKSTDYIEGVRQTQIGRRNGVYQPIYYSNAQVYEGAKSNVFVVKNNRIYTPKSNIFKGGTRDVLINDLKNGLRITERDFDLDFLLNADEIFLASSGKEIVPVVKAGGVVIGDGKVGKTTRLVIKKFREFVGSDKWR